MNLQVPDDSTIGSISLKSDDAPFYHVPVLADALMAGVDIVEGGCYLDCTVGGGGHSALLLEKAKAAGKNVWIVAIDRDAMAIAAAQNRLLPDRERVSFWHGNFSDYRPPTEKKFDGIIADLGVSSAQLDRPERGFSFKEPGDLDMRMDRQQKLTAADIINYKQENELADIFFHFGEERFSRRIARAIVSQRPFQTTTQLAEAIARSVPRSYRYGRIHPATRVFQALRIAVNQELSALETWLQVAPEWLRTGGAIGVISFHSLEDRLVKQAFREDSHLQIVTKKPIIATESEIAANPRSRSAKLRLAQKI